MKFLVVYSSLTGNTKMVGEAIAEVLAPECDIFPVEDNPDYSGYDLVVVGYWVDKGTADKKASAYLKSIKNSKVAVFATLGAEPETEHAQKSLQNGIDMLDSSNELMGKFICQGKIDPKLLEVMRKMFGTKVSKENFHAVDEKRLERHRRASTHPDAQDLANAKAVFAQIKAAMELNKNGRNE
ncbi:flavodoxin family protein [Megamonas hypermegale]|uniref:flavodoxin family protein n=1 Tax=Megamonas hypermegale TaxID=158847 RepID=UPI0025A44DBD|nr:flavodoxin family protein [Megamonas hypermegale]MDM8143057.1 flavodoxin family protein [Megamonas hypermegale]